MRDPADETLGGTISAKGQEAEARIGQLSGQMTLENIHDGSARSLEYSLLAVQILDEYLSAMDFLLGSPLMSAEDRKGVEEFLYLLPLALITTRWIDCWTISQKRFPLF